MITDPKAIRETIAGLKGKDAQGILREQRERIDITEPSRVVFLDIDGVLHTIRHTEKVGPASRSGHATGSNEWSAYKIESETVSALNHIIRETGAVVIILSTWRTGRTPAQLQAILEFKGFKGRIIGFTPDRDYLPRHMEIELVLERLGRLITSFIIIDDEDCAEVKGHFVETDAQDGLTMELADEAIHILKKQQNEKDIA